MRLNTSEILVVYYLSDMLLQHIHVYHKKQSLDTILINNDNVHCQLIPPSH